MQEKFYDLFSWHSNTIVSFRVGNLTSKSKTTSIMTIQVIHLNVDSNGSLVSWIYILDKADSLVDLMHSNSIAAES